MEWNLLPILHYDGKKMLIEASLTLSGEEADDFRTIGPVVVEGEIANVGGCLELSATGRAKIERICDRCAEPYLQDLVFPIEERYRKTEAETDVSEDPDILPLEGNVIEAEPLVYASLFLHLPSKALCKEDCLGICPTCGVNRNQETCSCDHQQTDPRFDILDQLL